MAKKNNLKPWAEVWQEILNLRVLDTAGLDIKPDADGWLSVRCPSHGDRDPSLRVNLSTGGVKCMSRGCFGEDSEHGSNLNDLMDFVLDSAARQKGKKPKDVVADLAERRMLPAKLLLDVFDVRPAPGGYSLAGCDPWIDPDIDDEDDKYHTDHRRFKRGAWIDPNATTRPKYQWQPSLRRSQFSAQDLVYNIHNIKGRQVYVVAGEPDVWVMHHNKMPAVSFMTGEGAQQPSTRAIDRLASRGVEEAIIIYDLDPAGEEGADKLASLLTRHGIAVTILTLPDEVGKKGDVTDLWLACDADRDKFESALAACERRSFTADVRARIREHHEPTPVPTLPAECWTEPFDSYRKSLVKTTASPDEYHFFALMNVLGALLGRRINVFYARKLYPNQYTCLIGPTGKAFKSTAMEKAESVLKEIDRHLHVSSGGGSAEGLLEAMAFADADPEEYPTIRSAMGQIKPKKDDNGDAVDETYLHEKLHRRLLVLQDEFTVLLAKAKGGGRAGGGTMIPHLLNAFNAPTEIKLPTRNKPLIVVNPTVSILSGSTEEFLGKHFEEEDWHSGFGNRLLFVSGETRAPIPLPEPPDESLWGRVIEHVKAAFDKYESAEDSRRSVTFTFTDTAKVRWEQLFQEWNEEYDEYNADQMAATQRTPEYAMKFALLYAATALLDEPKIGKTHMELGFKAARFVAEVNRRLVTDLLAEANAVKEQKLIAYLNGQGPQTRRELQQRFSNWGSGKFNDLVKNLLEAEVLYENKDGSLEAYR